MAAGCITEPAVVHVTAINIDQDNVTMYVGDKMSFTATVYPENASDKTYTWSTDDPHMNVVALGGNTIVAIGPGMANISATTTDGAKVDTRYIIVKEKESVNPGDDPGEDPGEDPSDEGAVQGLDVNATSQTVQVGEEVYVEFEITPSDAKDFEWKVFDSSSDAVLTKQEVNIDKYTRSVRFTAVGAGEREVKAEVYCNVSKKTFTASCTVVVTEADIVNVEGIECDHDQVTLYPDGEGFVIFKVLPYKDAVPTDFDWVDIWIDDESVAKIEYINDYSYDPDAKYLHSVGFRGVAPGHATLYARVIDNNTLHYYNATCEITVEDGGVPTTSISVTHTNWNAKVGETLLPGVTVMPENATDPTYTITTVDDPAYDKGIVAVTEEGRLVAVYPGSTCLEYKTNNGGNVAYMVVSIDRASKGTINKVDYHFVDLDLPSNTLWCGQNIGAKKPYDYGYYYAWGDTDHTGTKDWAHYKWGDYSKHALTKYCTDSANGKVDKKKTLDKDDDVANTFSGGNLDMPTKAQVEELIGYTVQDHATLEGVSGMVFLSKKNKKAFFVPASGMMVDSGIQLKEHFICWTKNLSSDSDAYSLDVNPDAYASVSTAKRCIGLPVRPVWND